MFYHFVINYVVVSLSSEKTLKLLILITKCVTNLSLLIGKHMKKPEYVDVQYIYIYVDYYIHQRKAIRQQARQGSSQTQLPSTTELDPSSQTETASLISIPPESQSNSLMCPCVCLSLCLGPRPIAPASFNEPHVQQELLEYYHHCHRKPGEPKLIPHLLLNYPITQQTPRLEMYL